MFAEKLKEARAKKGISQAALGRRLGVSQQAVAKWEKGASEPDIEQIVQISEYLQCDIKYLMGQKDDISDETGSGDNQNLIVPDILKDMKFAFHRGEFEDLTQDEINALAVIAKTIKAQRKGDSV